MGQRSWDSGGKAGGSCVIRGAAEQGRCIELLVQSVRTLSSRVVSLSRCLASAAQHTADYARRDQSSRRAGRPWSAQGDPARRASWDSASWPLMPLRPGLLQWLNRIPAATDLTCRKGCGMGWVRDAVTAAESFAD